jgi:hypothetical protein
LAPDVCRSSNDAVDGVVTIFYLEAQAVSFMHLRRKKVDLDQAKVKTRLSSIHRPIHMYGKYLLSEEGGRAEPSSPHETVKDVYFNKR